MKTFLKITIGLVLAVGLFAFAFYRTPQERAFSAHLKAAQKGDVAAMLGLAQDYLNGTGTKPDIMQAEQWYEQAAAQGDAQAQFELARLYQSGQIRADEQAALAYLQASAEQNFVPAQYTLANMYSQGRNVPQHAGQALFWYMRAAENESAAAQAQVAALATEKPELSAQVSEFIETLRAAQTGDAQAQFKAAQAYRHGDPVLQDNEAAFTWFKKAWETSQHTLSEAALALSDQYATGEGTRLDEDKAMEFLAQAAELKNPQAQYQLGEQAYAEQPPRLEDAFAWFSNAAAQGHAQAQYMTGFMLLQGQGTASSLPLALHFFEQAAEQNNASAQYVLGQIYTQGLGVKRSRIKGRAYLESAAENGSENAAAMLAQ